MNTDVGTRRRGLFIVVVGGLALIVLVGVGVFGLLTGPGPAAANPSTPGSTVDPSEPAKPPIDVEPVVPSREPEVFARRVATALFTWSTTGHQPADYAQPLIGVADATETAALVDDIYAYLPSSAAWAELRTHQTQQWLTIDTAVVPEMWSVAQRQALPGQIPEGTAAYAIEGTRHRAGTWRTQGLQTARPVAFTVFVICPPASAETTEGSCRLLRLSRPDEPLR